MITLKWSRNTTWLTPTPWILLEYPFGLCFVFVFFQIVSWYLFMQPVRHNYLFTFARYFQTWRWVLGFLSQKKLLLMLWLRLGQILKLFAVGLLRLSSLSQIVICWFRWKRNGRSIVKTGFVSKFFTTNSKARLLQFLTKHAHDKSRSQKVATSTKKAEGKPTWII